MKSWIDEIDRASTKAEVVATTRDYVSLWAPPELAQLPEDCRVIVIREHADIPKLKERLAAGIARARLAANAERVADLLAVVERASERLGALYGTDERT
jgi:hypothetical protein